MPPGEAEQPPAVIVNDRDACPVIGQQVDEIGAQLLGWGGEAVLEVERVRELSEVLEFVGLRLARSGHRLVAVGPGGLDQHCGAAFLCHGAVIGWPVVVGAARVGEDGA
jgi:hypothetical protein